MHSRIELSLRGGGNEGKPAKKTRDKLKKENQKKAWSLDTKDIFQGGERLTLLNVMKSTSKMGWIFVHKM